MSLPAAIWYLNALPVTLLGLAWICEWGTP